MTPDERQAELDRLNAMADARRNQPGYADNVTAIEARIAELQAEADANPA